MAQSSFPFEGIDTTETQYSQLFRTFQDSVNGTYGGTELTVAAGTGLAVDVALGQAMVRGHFYVSTATESLSLTTADATNPRLDLVVLRLDPVANSIVLAVKDGTPAGSPTAPALVQTDAGTYEMALATVLVPATSGVPTTITDKRQFMGSRISLWSDDTRPTTAFPHVGFNTTAGTFEGYDPALASWGPIGGGGGVTVSATAPTSPTPENGDLWWDSLNGELYVYYVDGTSSQWVAAAGPSVTVAATAPTGYEGQLWLDSTDGSMYVYYTDPGGANAQWIGAVSRSGGILQVVSTTKTDTFTTTSAGFTDITGLSASITPSSASSKIYCVATVNGASTTGNDSSRAMVRLLRDATAIAVGDANGSRTQMSFNLSTRGTNSGKILMNGTVNFLDSPATTSATTYKMQVASEGVTAFINRQESDADNSDVGLAVSTITLMEVAG